MASRRKKPQTKKDVLIAFLERGLTMIHLDTRRDGVQVPSQHAGDPHLRLNLSYRFGIPDLVIDETSVQATLSFKRVPFRCVIPWAAVFAISSSVADAAEVWDDDVPRDLAEALARAHGMAKEKQERQSRPKFQAIDGQAGRSKEPEPAPALASAPVAPPSEAPKRPNHLRLVK